MGKATTDLGLQGRFLMGLAIILLAFNLFIACAIYFWGKQTIEQDALRQTELVLAAVDSVRDYVREELRPRMYELLGKDQFVLEAMSSSYVSTAIMERFRNRMPDFTYRRVATRPLNSAFRPNKLEEEIIAYFQAHPGTDDWQGIHSLDGTRYFMRFEPIFYADSCLRCHGSRAAAPAEIGRRYPDAQYLEGKNDPPALVSLAIPLDTSLLQIKDRALSVFVFAFLCIVLLYSLISFFFNRVVVQSLRGLLALFRNNLRDAEGEQLYRIASSKDAIHEITAAAEAMADYIRETDTRLSEYADNLEQQVEERTNALRFSQKQLRDKVLTRNRELYALNSIAELITRSPDLPSILPELLNHALTVVPASGAALYLLRHGRQRLELQQQCGSWSMPPVEIIDLGGGGTRPGGETFEAALLEAAEGQMSFLASEKAKMDALSVPLCCRGNIHGVMIFVEVDFMELDAEVTSLLSSIGQQAGILVESMRNIRKLISNAALLQSVVDGISDLVVLLDHNLVLRMVNKAFASAYPETRLGGRLPVDCPFADLPERPRFPEGRPINRIIRQEDDKIFDVHFYPIFEVDRQLESIVCYAKDITLQQRAEELRQHTEKLAAIGQLAAGIAHEINNPLGVILCHSELARGDLDSPGDLRRDLRIIEKHGNACKKIVADLLHFARGGDPVKGPASINKAVSEVVEMVRRQLEKDNIALSVDLDPGLPDMDMDREKIKQVILNLIINAAQAVSPRGSIYIVTDRQADGSCRIVVEDDGPGIPAEDRERIFEPFFSTKAPGEGTGLGLSVSYGIVKEHGGTISAGPRPGGGARLTVLLPATS